MGVNYNTKIATSGLTLAFDARNARRSSGAGSDAVYTTPGTYTWTCPAGVTSVSAVCVGAGARNGGGGGLGYKNNITVVPGTGYTVVVGDPTTNPGGNSYFISAATVQGAGGSYAGTGGTYVGDGGGNGGDGVGYGSPGGGGAGGYAGKGGNAGGTGTDTNCTAGSGGGGGGGDTASGGGVGLYGQGANGAKGTTGSLNGKGGSGGSDGGGYTGTGGAYGGGGAFGGTSGGSGAVRIVWPGNVRTFPATNVSTSNFDGWSNLCNEAGTGYLINGAAYDSATESVLFDGINESIYYGALSGSYASFTVIVWFYPTAVTNYRNVLDCNHAYYTSGNVGPRLEMNTSGNLLWAYSNITATGDAYVHNVVGSGLAVNTWHCAAITYDGSGNTSKTYYNGNDAGFSRSAAGSPTGFVGSFNSVRIGRGFNSTDSGDRLFQGRIASCMIYNRALTADEIRQNFNAFRGRYGL